MAGNKTFKQAKALGLRIHEVITDRRALVVVRRKDLDLHKHESARALAIRDNRIAELDLQWDAEVLQELKLQGLDLGDLWSNREWAELLGETALCDPADDRVLEPRPTQIQRGGTSFSSIDILCFAVMRPGVADVSPLLAGQIPHLMCTDPPYGVNYQADWRYRVYPKQRTAVGTVLNDDQASWSRAFQHFPGDVIYAWHAGVKSAEAASALREADFEIRSQIIWVKSHFVLSRAAYHWGHEPCFYAVRRGGRATWLGDRSQSTVWSVPNLNPMGGTRNGENTPTGHSTQKPVRLFEVAILNHAPRASCVYDPFAGSSSTLIAGEKASRIALVMDLDPRYVQVTLDRWETFTGRRARRIGKNRRRHA